MIERLTFAGVFVRDKKSKNMNSRICLIFQFALLFLLGAYKMAAQSTDYTCSGGCFEVFRGTPDTVVVFSGVSNVNYLLTMNKYAPKTSDIPPNTDKTELKYDSVVEMQIADDGSRTPSSIFRLNNDKELLVWQGFIKNGERYLLKFRYFLKNDPSIILGRDSLVIKVDTAAPKFTFPRSVDTIFIGDEPKVNDSILIAPENVKGADTIKFVDSSGNRLPAWLSLDTTTGAIKRIGPADKLGAITLSVQAYRRSRSGSSIKDETRPDRLGRHDYTVTVVDSPTIIYRDTIIAVGSPDGFISPTVDLKGISYQFGISQTSGLPNVPLPANASQSVDNANGTFSWKQNNFTQFGNKLTYTIDASTPRYGGKTITRTFTITIIDTPQVKYKSNADFIDTVMREYEQPYIGDRDTIRPVVVNWRQDTGRFHLVEVSIGRRDDNGDFVELFNSKGSKSNDAAFPTDADGVLDSLKFDTTTGAISWHTYSDALEYNFKVLASNKAGLSPKQGEDTARLRLIIKPGKPTIFYRQEDKLTFGKDGGQKASTLAPIINWKGIPVAQRRIRFYLDSFEGSISDTTYGIDKDQSRISGLLIDSPFAYQRPDIYISTAGQFSISTPYPTNMRAGKYNLRVYIWNSSDSASSVNDTVHTLRVLPISPSSFLYELKTDTAQYNAFILWRALSAKRTAYFQDRSSLKLPYRFLGEVIDSNNTYDSEKSMIQASFNSGGDTVRFFIDTILKIDGLPVADTFKKYFALQNSKTGSFLWSGAADSAYGNIDKDKPADQGVRYRIKISVKNAAGSASDSFIFAVFKPRPVLLLTKKPLDKRTIYRQRKPIDGTRKEDTVIEPFEYTEEINKNNVSNWFSRPGQDAGLASYEFFNTRPADKDKISIDSPNVGLGGTLGKAKDSIPKIIIHSAKARRGNIPYNIRAVNSLGISSLTPPLGYRIDIVDTPRGNRYVRDTLKLTCDFKIDTNRLTPWKSEDEITKFAGNDFLGDNLTERRSGRICSIDAVTNLDTADWGKAFKLIQASAANASEELNLGMVSINEMDGATRLLQVGVPYRVRVKIINSLTTGDADLPARPGAFDTTSFVVILKTKPPFISYPNRASEEVFNKGGVINIDSLEWFCEVGKFVLLNMDGAAVNADTIGIDTLSGQITWTKKLAVGTHQYRVVAKNSQETTEDTITIKINVAPPEDFKYIPDSIEVFYGKADTSVIPSINWNGNVGTYGLPLFGTTLNKNDVSINPATGRIQISDKIPVGRYTVRPSAVNIGGQVSTSFVINVKESPPIIAFTSNNEKISTGTAGSISPSQDFTGGSGAIKYFLLDTVLGISIDEKTGTLHWTGQVPSGTHQLRIVAQNTSFSDTTTLTLNVEEAKLVPNAQSSMTDEYILFPNPITANGAATLRFTVKDRSTISIRLLNLFGQEVKNMYVATVDVGTYDKVLSFANVIPGIYILEIQTETNTHRKRIIISTQ